MEYNIEIDINYNAMAQAIEIDERSGRYVYETGWEYTPERRDEFWPQFGVFWYRNSAGQAVSTFDTDIPF